MKASQAFAVGKNKITWVGSNFKDWFYDMEIDSAKSSLYGKTLERSMYDSEIQKELNPTEVTLGEVLNAIKTNKELLTNGWANIFYTRSLDGDLRAVNVDWGGGGWGVGAGALDDDRWDAGNQVFSRNSFDTLKPSEPLTSGPFVPLTLEIGGKKYEIQTKEIS